VPQPVDIVPVETGALLIMEALQAVTRGPRQWREIGVSLARMHRVKSAACGFERNGFWGPLHQDNTLTPDWPTFYRERRLEPLLRTALDSANLPAAVAAQVETVGARLAELCGPETTPTLLHGDAQANNFISTAEGAYAIDAAVYFGDPEMDLAAIDLWQPVPDAVLQAYGEEMPIDPGFTERRDLWRMSAYLAAVALEGSMYLNMLTGALRKYL
jgi:fructosamine-3-kinase